LFGIILRGRGEITAIKILHDEIPL
jgi:hypothetical protein